MLKHNQVIFALFLLVFLGFFLQYPLQSSLTGDIDAIGNLAMYKQLQSVIDGYFGSGAAGSLCYPVDKVWVYFGADFGIGIIHVIFNYIGFSDLWAHYLFMSLLFAGNAFSLFLLLAYWFKDRQAAVFGALIFCLAQFTLGNLENPNTLVFFPGFLSLYYYFRSLDENYRALRNFIIAAGLGVCLIYLSPYNFLYHCIIWGVFILAKEGRNISKAIVVKYGLTAIAYGIIMLPFIRFYLFHNDLDIDYNYTMTTDITSRLGLAASDYLRCLPNHLYMGDQFVELESWTGRIKAAYIGVGFYILALIGLTKGRLRGTSLIFILIGLIMATGPFIVLSPEHRIFNITWPLYEYLNFGNVFRITSRGFFIALFGLSILATSGFITLKKARMFIPLLVLPLFTLAENISWPMHTYDHQEVVNPDTDLIEYLATRDETEVILSLPSNLFDYEGTHREYVYMYWQYYHGHNTLNCSLGFFPTTRTRVNDLLGEGEVQKDDLRTLIEENDVSAIVFHRDLADGQHQNTLHALQDSEFLKEELNTERSILFRVTE